MNWRFPTAVGVILLHNCMSCIILLQNLAGKESFDRANDCHIEVGAQARVEHCAAEKSREKRKVEENEETQEPVRCYGYFLRKNRFHPHRKRPHHFKRYRQQPMMTSQSYRTQGMVSTMMVQINPVPMVVNNMTLLVTNTSNRGTSNMTQPITPSMEHEIKMKHKNRNVLIKGRKHCIYHEKQQDVLNDVSCDSHHTGQRAHSVPVTKLHDIQDNDQTILYQVYEKNLKNSNTKNPTVDVNENMTNDLNFNNENTNSETKSKTKMPGNKIEQGVFHLKNFRSQNMKMNQTSSIKDGNKIPVQVNDGKQEKKIPYKESQEIDLFTPIKELEAFIASMSKDDCETYFQQNWHIIVLVPLLLFFLLICCLYYCLSARIKSSNDATLFLIKPVSCTNTNRSSRTKRKEKSIPSNGFLVKSKNYDTDSDDAYTTGRDRKSKRGYDYGNYRRCCGKEEEERLLGPKYDTRRFLKQNYDVCSYREDNKYKGNILYQEPFPEQFNVDPIVDNHCFYSNKEIKELFKQNPKHIFSFSSVECQSAKQNKPESNVESYAETVTSSAKSRFKVLKPNNKKIKFVKRTQIRRLEKSKRDLLEKSRIGR